jgi:hypothetical protein
LDSELSGHETQLRGGEADLSILRTDPFKTSPER